MCWARSAPFFLKLDKFANKFLIPNASGRTISFNKKSVPLSGLNARPQTP